MNARQATRLYNQAEREVRRINATQSFIEKAIGIEEYLIKRYGEEAAEEIIYLVFEKECN